MGHIRTLITRRQSHNDDILRELDIRLGIDQLHYLIINDACIWIINSTMSTDQ